MTCKHGRNDPNCSSHPDHPNNPANQRVREIEARTPDKEKYSIEQFERIGAHVVLKVLYPNCSKCSYEGQKVMVFLNITEGQMLKWKQIDPHFRSSNRGNMRHLDGDKQFPSNEAPSPAARFPASVDGWADAVSYARGKVK